MFRRRSCVPIWTIGVLAAGLGATWLSVAAQNADERAALFWIEVGRGAAQGARATADAGELETLRARLAAAEQRLSAAVTAAKETEDRLAEEIGRRAALDAKNKDLSEDLTAAQKTAEAAEAKAERAVSELAKIEAVLPASRLVSPNLVATPEAAAAGNAAAAETTASIDKTDSAAGATPAGTPAVKTGAAASDAGEAAAQSADAAAAKPEPPKRTVRRKKKSKPKTEYSFNPFY